jgi:hypothetical protein
MARESDKVAVRDPDKRGLFVTAEQKNYVEQHQDCDNHFEREHAALVELSDHEFVQLARGF